MASVLITGASKGIGRATVAEFARRGHRVTATARDPRTLGGLPADQRLVLDVTDPDTIAPAVREAVLPGMRARGHGRPLFVSSTAGRIVRPRQAAYAATKWALEALVEASLSRRACWGSRPRCSNPAP